MTMVSIWRPLVRMILECVHKYGKCKLSSPKESYYAVIMQEKKYEEYYEILRSIKTKVSRKRKINTQDKKTIDNFIKQREQVVYIINAQFKWQSHWEVKNSVGSSGCVAQAHCVGR